MKSKELVSLRISEIGTETWNIRVYVKKEIRNPVNLVRNCVLSI